MNASKMSKMSEGLEHQYLFEDSKNRIYLSLVPSKKARQQRIRDTVRALRITFGRGSAVAVQALMSIGAGLLTYSILAARLEQIRGYQAIGSEGCFAVAVGLLTFRALHKLFSLWRR